jgi:methyl-accepting chemotaxis protein
MWFSSKNTKIMAEQVVITHKDAAVIVDREQKVIASNQAYGSLSQSFNKSDDNQALTFLLKHHDKSSDYIKGDKGLHFKLQTTPFTIKHLESCLLYVFEPVSEPILAELSWQKLIGLGQDSYAVFDLNNKLVTANFDSINSDSLYLDQKDTQLLEVLNTASNSEDGLLCLSEKQDVYVHVYHHLLASEKGKLSAFVLSKRSDSTNNKQLELLSQVVSNTSTSVLITDKNGFVEYVNPGFEILSGYTLEEV